MPVFSFGESDVYITLPNPEDSFLRRLQDKLKRYTNLGFPAFQGRGIFNYSFGLLPYRTPIHTVIGEPIHVDKVEEPTKAQIMELHDRYINALTQLFDEHKDKYLDLANKNVHLEIV